jgi:8-oxo-dGTP diphosphatase
MPPLPGAAPYEARDYPPFAVTVDLVVLTVRDGVLSALVIRRGEDPFAGYPALPGGFVRPDESLDQAAARELAEETGLADLPVHLEQLATYGDVGRDPRMRVVSVAYLALAPDLPTPRPGGDAAAASWQPVAPLLPGLFDGGAGRGEGSGNYSGDGSSHKSGGSSGSDGSSDGGEDVGRVLAFDHGRILADGVERARAKLEYSPLAAAFCPPRFTVGELRRVYEAVWGVALDPRNFHRKVTGTPGFLVPAGGTTARQGGRPAQLFHLGTAGLLNPPMLRPA